MNLLFFLTPKQDVLYIYEDFTLRQTLEKWSNQRYATIPVLKRNGEYVGSITEGDILWGMKNLHGLDLEASEDVPISRPNPTLICRAMTSLPPSCVTVTPFGGRLPVRRALRTTLSAGA